MSIYESDSEAQPSKDVIFDIDKLDTNHTGMMSKYTVEIEPSINSIQNEGGTNESSSSNADFSSESLSASASQNSSHTEKKAHSKPPQTLMTSEFGIDFMYAKTCANGH